MLTLKPKDDVKSSQCELSDKLLENSISLDQRVKIPSHSVSQNLLYQL